MKTESRKNKIVTKPNCFGPIINLEKHLRKDWWKELFNDLYLKTDSDVVENELNTIEDVNYIIKATNISQSEKILDICCGQGRHLLEFAKRGYKNLVGIDQSQYLIRLAKKRALFNRYFDLNFYEGDARKIRLQSDSLDLVTILGNSFGYFEYQDDDLTVLKEVNRILKPKGKLFLDIANGTWLEKNFQKRSWEWIDKSLLVCRERNLSEDKRLISREVIINVNKGVIKDQFYAERLYTFEEIKHLLIQANFENVTLLDHVQSGSTRNQDLGMMENRMFILAEVPEIKNQININSNYKKTINCHVLLGDPYLPDQVKNNGQFNPEDNDTVKRLKNALNELKDYNFTYIDNHKKIFSHLNSLNKSTLIFNLCDEGFKNDPKKELHIPAVLEMLDLPYTGSNPSTLAICYNKSIINSFARNFNIKTPKEFLINSISSFDNLQDYPYILKPSLGDGSMGITQRAVCYKKEDLISYYNWLNDKFPNNPIILQEFLIGNEYSVSIIGNTTNLEILPILEVDYSSLPKNLPQFLCYESKWVPESPYWSDIRYKRASLIDKEQKELIESSKLLFKSLECRDYARFDFRKDKNGNIKFLEVNPNPGWCWDGKLNLMAGFANISYSQLLDKILKSALQRYYLKN